MLFASVPLSIALLFTFTVGDLCSLSDFGKSTREQRYLTADLYSSIASLLAGTCTGDGESYTAQAWRGSYKMLFFARQFYDVTANTVFYNVCGNLGMKCNHCTS